MQVERLIGEFQGAFLEIHGNRSQYFGITESGSLVKSLICRQKDRCQQEQHMAETTLRYLSLRSKEWYNRLLVILS
jgi:hypothetical protein